jgi:hypothetical protein
VVEPYTDTVDYSRVLAGFVCFLRFIRDLTDTFGGDPTATWLGPSHAWDPGNQT